MPRSRDQDLARQKKKSQQTQNVKGPGSDTQALSSDGDEAVVIGGKNLTYISKLATSQKKKKKEKATSVLVQLSVKKGMFLSPDAAI